MRRLLRVLAIVVLVGVAVAVVARLRRGRGTPPDPTVPWPPVEPLESPSARGAPESSGAAGAADADAGWVEPDDDGSCPVSHPVKAKLSSGIYHRESGLNYQRTKADRCYRSPEAAEADRLRASKN